MAWGKTSEGDSIGTGAGLGVGAKFAGIGEAAAKILGTEKTVEKPKADIRWASIPVQHTFSGEQLRNLKSIKLSKDSTKTSNQYSLFCIEEVTFEEKRVNGRKVKTPKGKKIKVLGVSLIDIKKIQAGKTVEILPVFDDSKQYINTILFSQYSNDSTSIGQFTFEEKHEEKLLREREIRQKLSLRVKTQSGKEITVFYTLSFDTDGKKGKEGRVKKCIIEGYSESTVENIIATQKDRSTSKIKFRLKTLPKQIHKEIIDTISQNEKNKLLKEGDIIFVKQDEIRAIATGIYNKQRLVREQLGYSIIQKKGESHPELTGEVGSRQMKIADNVKRMHGKAKVGGQEKSRLEKENIELKSQISKLLSLGHNAHISHPETTRYIEVNFGGQRLTLLIEVIKGTRKVAGKGGKMKVEDESFDIVIKGVIDLNLNSHNLKYSSDAQIIIDEGKKSQIILGKFNPGSSLYYSPLNRSQLFGLFDTLRLDIYRCLQQSDNVEWKKSVQDKEIMRTISGDWSEGNKNGVQSSIHIPGIGNLIKGGYELDIEGTGKTVAINDTLRLQFKQDTGMFYAVNGLKGNKVTELVIFGRVKQVKGKKIILEMPKNEPSRLAIAKSLFNYVTEGRGELDSQTKTTKRVKDAVSGLLSGKKSGEKKWKVRYHPDSKNIL